MDLNLNPQNLDHVATIAWAWTVAFLPRLVAAVAVLLAGNVLARWASRGVSNFSLHAKHIDPILRPVLASAVRYAILILVFVVALSQIGVQTASLLAVLGAAGLAIGLALQGTLSNIAAGLMLLWLRPFRIGDFIEVNGMAGTVREIGLFVCHLETFDGIFLFAPNSAIWNNALRNHTRNVGRLVSLQITVASATAPLERVRVLLLGAIADDQRILKSPPPRAFVESVSGAATVFTVTLWSAGKEIGELQRSVIARIKRQLEAAGIEKLEPQIQRLVPPDADPSRLLPLVEPEVD